MTRSCVQTAICEQTWKGGIEASIRTLKSSSSQCRTGIYSIMKRYDIVTLAQIQFSLNKCICFLIYIMVAV